MLGFEQHAQAVLQPMMEWLRDHREFVLPFIFLVAFGECVALLSFLIPATLIFTAFGVFAGAAQIDPLPLALAAAAGAGSGFTVSYWVGQWLGPRAHTYWPFRTRPEMLQRGHDFFEKWGAPGIFIGHFVGPVRAVIALVAGMVRMDPLPFHLANWSASLAWGFLFFYGGNLLGQKAGALTGF